jgi:hypothetical protein
VFWPIRQQSRSAFLQRLRFFYFLNFPLLKRIALLAGSGAIIQERRRWVNYLRLRFLI